MAAAATTLLIAENRHSGGKTDGPPDETDINLRAYFSHMSDEKLKEYNPRWTDEEIIAWDQENFKDDGTLFLICSERDVEVEKYRRVLEEHIRFRSRTSDPMATDRARLRGSRRRSS